MTENTPAPPDSEKSAKEEIKAKLREAKSADEVKAIAAENGKELTDDEAQHLFDMFHDDNPSTGKLSDEELDQVMGGYGEWNRDKENTYKKMNMRLSGYGPISLSMNGS